MTILNKLKSTWQNFANDNRGVAAIEFGFAAPVLVITLLVFSTGLEMGHKSANVGKVASTVGDILAQSPVTNKQAIERATRAGLALIGPEAAENLELLVTGVHIRNEGDETNPDYRGFVDWFYHHNSRQLTPPAIDSYSDKVPSGILNKEGFVIITRARLRDEPTFINEALGLDNAHYDYENFFIPRSSIKTDCNDCSS